MKQLVIFPKGSLSAKDKERMSKEGYLAIEADDPSKIILPMPTLTIQGDDLLIAALSAMGSDRMQATLRIKADFVDQMLEILKAKK